MRFRADDAPFLVLAAAADRLVERWRLLIVSPAREIVCDEIFDRPIGLSSAHCADRSEVLVLSGSEVLVVRVRS